MMVPHPSFAECRLPDKLTMEELWVNYQSDLCAVIERRAGCDWIDALKTSLYGSASQDEYAQGIRKLVFSVGLATEGIEIAEILEHWQQSLR
jgi:hypothetical protein